MARGARGAARFVAVATLVVAGAVPASAQVRVEPRVGTASDIALGDIFNFDGIGEMAYAALLAEVPLAGDGRPFRSPERWEGRTLGLRLTWSRPGRYDRGLAVVHSRARTTWGRQLSRLDVMGLARGWAGRLVYVEGGFGVSRTAVGEETRGHGLISPTVGFVLPVAFGLGIDVTAGAQYRWAPWGDDYVGFAFAFGLVGLPAS